MTQYNNNATMNIMSTFSVAVDGRNSYSPAVYYVSNGKYKWNNLYGHGSINTIKIQIFWCDFFNNYYPLKLGNSMSSQISLLFRRV